jgi:hypothetical protein
MQSAYRIRAGFFAVIPVLLLLPTLAFANNSDDRDKPRRAAEIIASIDDQKGEPSWTSHIRIKKKYGLQFKHKLGVGDEQVIFSVHGPLLSRKSLGLGFEIKF